jgi:hypothetical protein
MCALFERAIDAEGSDVDLDEVAAAAMAAVESAVKDEVEAAAVVSATQEALKQILQNLQAIGGRPAAEAAAAALEINSAATASVDGAAAAAAAGSSSTPAADAIQLLDSLTGAAAGGAVLRSVDAAGLPGSNGGSTAASSAVSPAASPIPSVAAQTDAAAAASLAGMDGKAAKQSKQAALLQAAGYAVAVAAAYSFVQSPACEALIAAAKGVASSIAERIGPIHINPAEQGLLETIWLLLTSIVCVPAVCKFIPGGSPVLGYLVRAGAARVSSRRAGVAA